MLGWCGRHVQESAGLYDILVRVSTLGATGWDQCVNMSAEDCRVLRDHRNAWTDLRFFRLAASTDTIEFFIVSDASLERFGAAIYDSARQLFTEPLMSDIYEGQFDHHEIFFLEFQAAILGVRAIEDRVGPKNIVVLSDNSALVQVLNKR